MFHSVLYKWCLHKVQKSDYKTILYDIEAVRAKLRWGAINKAADVPNCYYQVLKKKTLKFDTHIKPHLLHYISNIKFIIVT